MPRPSVGTNTTGAATHQSRWRR